MLKKVHQNYEKLWEKFAEEGRGIDNCRKRGLENTEGDVQGLDQARMKGLALGKGRYKDKVVKLRVRESGHQSEL